jgi:hypothetical protein
MVKPDVYLRRFVKDGVGHPVTDRELVKAVTQAARHLGQITPGTGRGHLGAGCSGHQVAVPLHGRNRSPDGGEQEPPKRGPHISHHDP